MTIIVFLVDTSASMNQRTYQGMSLLDTAKGAVETFMKIRSRDPASRMDRYMLLTFEDPPANVKAGWKESHSTFAAELKQLDGHGLTTLGPALKHTFDLLNINRMQSGIDTYGQGRCPFYLEPAVIVCITDGRKLTTQSTVQAELNLPMMNSVPGSELTKEPFRWDQRLFGIVLKVPAVPQEFPGSFIPAAEDSPIDCMCDVTGGRSYAVSSQRMLHQCLESIVQKVQSGVVINFEKIGPDPPSLESDNVDNKPNGGKENLDANRVDVVNEEEKNKRAVTPTPPSSIAGNFAWHTCRKLIYVPRSAQKGYSVGHWPIPESFWPDLNSPMLPPRSAHPVIKFSCTSCEPLVVENFPFDKYELEPSPLTQYILERRQPNSVWQVFIGNSAKYSDIGHAFGYLKASSNLSVVNLFVMPYNYPVLLPLLDDLFKIHKLKPTQKWRQQFESYLKTMPIYYAQPLRRALARLGVQNLVPDQLDNCLSYSVVSYLKKLKNQAKVEYERLVNSVGQRVPQSEGIKVTPKTETSLLQRKDFKEIMAHYGSNMAMLKQELVEFPTFVMAVPDKELKPQPYKNAYDINRQQLVDQVTRMRANFLQSNVIGTRLQDQESLHNVAIGTMGNYQDYLKRMPSPLREIENTPVRQHMFGNPFKVNKNLMLIDEADEAMPGQEKPRRKHLSQSSIDSPPPSLGQRKRKAGPLPRDLPYRKLLTPPPEDKMESPPASPIPSSTFTPPPAKKHKLQLAADNIDMMDEVFELPLSEENNHVDDTNDDLEIDLVTNHNDNIENVEDILQENNVDEHLKQSGAVILNKKTKARLKVEKDHNARVLQVILKEVKRPGKNFDQLLEKLSELQGSAETRARFVQEAIHEASRFKRRRLVDILEQFLKTMKRNESKGLKRQKSTSNHIRVKKSPTR